MVAQLWEYTKNYWTIYTLNGWILWYVKQYSYKKKIYAEQKKPDPKELDHIVYEALK